MYYGLSHFPIRKRTRAVARRSSGQSLTRERTRDPRSVTGGDFLRNRISKRTAREKTRRRVDANQVRRRSRDRLSTLGSVRGFAPTLSNSPGTSHEGKYRDPEKNIPRVPRRSRTKPQPPKPLRNTSVEFNHINYE